jgi:CRP-like cAMP-binding protein
MGWPGTTTESGPLDLKMKIKKPKTNRALSAFNAQAFLDTAGVARKVIDYRRGESIYSQGDAADNVMYIQKRGVKLSVVNGSGKRSRRRDARP